MAIPPKFPDSQGELLKLARGTLTKTEFAARMKVDRSCLSRYESEKLGAPTSVVNYCLRAIAAQFRGMVEEEDSVERALRYARNAVQELEQVTTGQSKAPRKS